MKVLNAIKYITYNVHVIYLNNQWNVVHYAFGRADRIEICSAYRKVANIPFNCVLRYRMYTKLCYTKAGFHFKNTF